MSWRQKRLNSPRPQVDDSTAQALAALTRADTAYHAACIDIGEPDVPVSDLPLDELSRAAQAVIDAVAHLRSTQE